MKKVHAYVKEHNLSAGKGYSADEKLKRITGKEQFTLIELTRSVNQHLHKTRAQSSAGGGEDPAE
jgi:chromatin remodeling complex protein RSC6